MYPTVRSILSLIVTGQVCFFFISVSPVIIPWDLLYASLAEEMVKKGVNDNETMRKLVSERKSE